MKNFKWEKINYGNGESIADYYHAFYKNEELGCVRYYPEWKKWVWEVVDDGIIMSSSCLKEVIKKLEEVKQ